MSPKSAFIWGAQGQSIVLKSIMEIHGYKLSYLFDNNQNLKSPFKNVPLKGDLKIFKEWVLTVPEKRHISFAVAIAKESRGKERVKMQNKILKYGFTVLTLIHSNAFISKNVSIGNGSQILMGATISERVQIGESCILNTGSQVDHESILEDGVHIMPGAIITGCVHIGKYASIGAGAVVLPRLIIGEGAIVGAGAVVTKNVEPYTIVIGNPARIYKKIINK